MYLCLSPVIPVSSPAELNEYNVHSTPIVRSDCTDADDLLYSLSLNVLPLVYEKASTSPINTLKSCTSRLSEKMHHSPMEISVFTK